jgi:UDP-N-acetylmuramoyl-L-alanyl-D-glutamate--2,6-diaminopimelate ligase
MMWKNRNESGKPAMRSTEKTLIDLGLTPIKPFSRVVTGIFSDSRSVQPGALFAALDGVRVHGANFIPQALQNGAKAVLTDTEGYKIAQTLIKDKSIGVVVVQDPRAALAAAAALWFEKQPASMVAITGTNGKTSVASFCRQIWTELEISAVNIGTTGVEGAWNGPISHTTPDPLTLHDVLAKCWEGNITHAAIEASSHGLEQRRLDGVKLCAAGFTNFTQDHLDYHDSFDAYFAAKVGLFDRVLSPDGTAVINIDDIKGEILAKIVAERGQSLITVGQSDQADLALLSQRYEPTGQTIRFSWNGKTYQSLMPLIGGFQGENVLLAAGLVIGAGQCAEKVFEILRELKTVRGRMELAATRQNGATVFVDYAHTPDAIETAIYAFRPHVMGRLIAIIGAGGDRDPIKRPLMGAAAAACADYVIVTDDNPRLENPKDIRKMVLEGIGDTENIAEFGDRAEAILRGVDMLEPGDGLLITGKGHETVQVVGGNILPFNDVEQASVAVAALDGLL